MPAAVKEAKCNVCHFGKKRKDYNAYGVALSEFLKGDDYKKKRVKKEREKVKEEVQAAFKKVEAMQSPSGETWGKLFRDGKLPPDEKVEKPESEE